MKQRIPRISWPKFIPKQLGEVGVIPSYMLLLLSLGKKFIPHRPIKNVATAQMSSVQRNCSDLLRVLLWSCFFALVASKNVAHSVDLCKDLPFPCLHKSTGREASAQIRDQIGFANTTLELSVRQLQEGCYNGARLEFGLQGDRI